MHMAMGHMEFGNHLLGMGDARTLELKLRHPSIQ